MPNLIQRILDTIKDWLRKISGKENIVIGERSELMQYMQKSQSELVKLMKEGVGRQPIQLGKQTTARYSPIMKNSKGKYVQADRQVITSKDPDIQKKQVIDFVNEKVRGGKDVNITLDNGETITITERTAWKLGDRGNFGNEYYLVKGNAAGVIDEVIAVSKYKNSKPPIKVHSNEFGKYGFEYRTAYFRDLDGKYYKLGISAGINSDGKEAYNIGNIKETAFPDKSVDGSKAPKRKAIP